MSEQNIQIKNKAGDILYPQTKASLVLNNSNQNLGAVEAGAQVNVIETIKVNGTAQTVSNKEVNITIPAASEYSIIKDDQATEGYAATYHLTKDNVNVGAAINIPKDMVVQSGTVETCSRDDDPVSGYVVGDKYIDLVLANASSSHIYIKVSDLVDTYTAGTAITISGNQISVDIDTLKSTFAEVADLADYQPIIDASHKLSADLVDDTNATNKFVTASEKSTWNAKQDAISDLATIRSGAAAGATALQQSDVVSTYSASGTAPVNGQAISAALNDFLTDEVLASA